MLLPEKYESVFDVSSEGPSSGSLVNKGLNFPTKGLRSKRRKYFHVFQVEAYLTYCDDVSNVEEEEGKHEDPDQFENSCYVIFNYCARRNRKKGQKDVFDSNINGLLCSFNGLYIITGSFVLRGISFLKTVSFR